MSAKTLLQTVILDAASSSIELSSIPQNYDHLEVLISGKTTSTTSNDADYDLFGIQFNGSQTGYSAIHMSANGPNIDSYARTTTTLGGESYLRYSFGIASSLNDVNTFASLKFFIANYSSSQHAKSIINNEVSAKISEKVYKTISNALWDDTSPITSIKFASNENLAVGTVVSLYGIKDTTTALAAKATGGIIQTDGNYVYHTFTSSGTFTPTENLTGVEYLVIAGGGGTFDGAGGGAGAGGYRCSVQGELSGGGSTAESTISLTPQNYTVTVGAGGAGSQKGNDSTFGAITSLGGGSDSSGVRDGGSGSGAYGSATIGIGTNGQGNNGGNGTSVSGEISAGGGGGAGQVGATASSSSSPGAGGDGITSSISGSPVTRAGGGGGAVYSNFGSRTAAQGGSGGGGRGFSQDLGNVITYGQNGSPNTGGGAGGVTSGGYNLSGGSGIVIIRYAA